MEMNYSNADFKQKWGKPFVLWISFSAVCALASALVFLVSFLLGVHNMPFPVAIGLGIVLALSLFFSLPMAAITHHSVKTTAKRQKQWFADGQLHVWQILQDGFNLAGSIKDERQYAVLRCDRIEVTNRFIIINGLISKIAIYDNRAQKMDDITVLKIPRVFDNENIIINYYVEGHS